MTLEERVAQVRQTIERESAPWGHPPRLIAVTKYSTVEYLVTAISRGGRPQGALSRARVSLTRATLSSSVMPRFLPLPQKSRTGMPSYSTPALSGIT